MLGANFLNKSKIKYFFIIMALLFIYLYNTRSVGIKIEIPNALNACIEKETSRIINSDESSYDLSVTSLKKCNSSADAFLKGISVNSDEYDANHSSLTKYYESDIERIRQH